MKLSSVNILMFSIVLFIANLASASDDLDLQSETVVNGETKTYTARNKITVGPSFTVANGGEAILKAGSRITLLPGFHAQEGSKLNARIWNDDTAPTVVSTNTPYGQVVTSNGGPFTMLMTFLDDDSGIYSVTLLNENGTDITDLATFDDPNNPNTISYNIDAPENITYNYTLMLEDMAGNISQIDIAFTVDNIIPVTTVSQTGGTFGDPFTVSLTCSEEATIYYTTDGYTPFVGAGYTNSDTAPLDVLIDRSMNLQFFALDIAGNIEDTKSEVYILEGLPSIVAITSGIFNQAESRVKLTWTEGAGQVAGYHIYRSLSPFDIDILNQSRDGGYAPSEKLRISDSLSTTTSYYDTDIVSNFTYYYGVTTVDDQGIEGVISALKAVEIDGVTNYDNAVSKASAWLETTQNVQGYWGDESGLRMLTTSQVLNAFKLSGKDDAALHHALFYLRGHFADNNDYLARKIITLHSFGQNVDAIVNRLVAQSYIASNSIKGWGIRERLRADTASSSLGAIAVDQASSLDIGSVFSFLKDDSSLKSSVANQYSWINGDVPSVFVSSLVYNTLDTYYSSLAPVFDSSWISGSPNPDNSFGNGLIDTCAVLLWVSNLDEGVRNLAIDYLTSQQNANGSWDNDPYLTGLCLETLLSQ
jgi:hypothetical protein